MKQKAKIFDVYAGAYDEHKSVAIFTTRKDAEAFVKKYIKIYPYYLDTCEIRERSFGVPEEYADDIYYIVFMDKKGTIRGWDISADSSQEKLDYFINLHWEIHKSQSKVYKSQSKVYMVCFVITEDKEEAIRLTNEKRLQLIKDGKWPKDLEKQGERYLIDK